METIILILAVCLSNVFCLFVGARIGQKVNNNEPVKLPNPAKAIEEYKENKEYREEQDKLNSMLENINNYNGTGMGQRDLK